MDPDGEAAPVRPAPARPAPTAPVPASPAPPPPAPAPPSPAPPAPGTASGPDTAGGGFRPETLDLGDGYIFVLTNRPTAESPLTMGILLGPDGTSTPTLGHTTETSVGFSAEIEGRPMSATITEDAALKRTTLQGAVVEDGVVKTAIVQVTLNADGSVTVTRQLIYSDSSTNAAHTDTVPFDELAPAVAPIQLPVLEPIPANFVDGAGWEFTDREFGGGGGVGDDWFDWVPIGD